MSEEDVITLDSDDEPDPNVAAGADLIVGPTGTAVPVQQAFPKLPLPSDKYSFDLNS